jgi:hypothetical protein
MCRAFQRFSNDVTFRMLVPHGTLDVCMAHGIHHRLEISGLRKHEAPGGSVWDTKIGGGQQFGAADTFDGASIQTADFNDGTTFEMLPSVDAIQEFKVYVVGVPAQYGPTGGGVVTYGTKSGTNVLHGSAYEINRNTDYDANSWFNNGLATLYPQQSSSYQRPADKKNEYGGTFGGPVRIPMLYDGLKRTFFFFSWEQFRQTTGVSQQETVPTTATRKGDSMRRGLTANSR